MRKLFIILVAQLFGTTIHAQTEVVGTERPMSISDSLATEMMTVMNDTTVAYADTIAAVTDTIATTPARRKRKGPIGWLLNYLSSTNKPNNKKFDISFMLGPSYSAETSFTLGLVSTGLYSWNREDPTLRKSFVSLYGAFSVTGMVSIGVEGKNFLPNDRWRWNYLFGFMHIPTKVWGVGYTMGDDYKNFCKFTRFAVKFNTEFLYNPFSKVYVGPVVDVLYNYIFNKTNKPDGSPLTDYDGSPLQEKVFDLSMGLCLSFDTRDVVFNASKGVYLHLQQLVNPGTSKHYGVFGTTDLDFRSYHKVWRGGVIAYELHGQFNYGNVPWTHLGQIGGGYRMRGYYMGQYRDENIAELQLELRQHIWSRSGCVVWVGAGNVWGREKFAWRHTLPNFGIGYRWEFKQKSNVRIDIGFTKKDWNVCFNVNEAF
ncbi:MAG: BamA/TamA family outer membrane protein [Bacteroidaceae bacterium]|nr:BamA/TamA family outer membrane protein [Bacteroidaceae bacterium]